MFLYGLHHCMVAVCDLLHYPHITLHHLCAGGPPVALKAHQ